MAVSAMLNKMLDTPANHIGGKGGKITVLPGLCQLQFHNNEAKQAVSKVVDQVWKKA